MGLNEGQSAAVAGSAEAPAVQRDGLLDGALYVVGLLGLALLYFGAAKLGLSLAFKADQVTAVWPPTGIAIAAVLLFGYRVWPGIALGAFAANVTANETAAVACGVALGNTLEAVCGAWLVLRFTGPGELLGSLRGVVAWVGGAVLVATTVAATLGVTSLCLGEVQPWSDFGSLWFLWWLGDATGALLLGPLLLAWAQPLQPGLSRRRVLEAVALAVSVFVMGLLIFEAPVGVAPVRHGLVYGMIPIVCWAALRFGLPGVSAVSCVASGFAVWFTTHGLGPFAMGDLHDSLMLLMVFTAVVAATGLFLAGADADRRRNESALRDSELRYSSMVEAVPGILFTTRADGGNDFVNTVFYEYTGLKPGTAGGEGWASALHPEDVPRTLMRWHSCVTNGAAFDMEFRLRARDGSYRWFNSRSLPVRDAHDQILLWVGACIDIDAQKRAEQRLREDERRKDRILLGLGAELRDPLAPIRYAVQALDGLHPVAPETTRRVAGMIEREVGQMASLIDDLLEVSRIAQGRSHLRLEPCDLTSITAGAVERCRGELEAREIALSESLPSDPLRLVADPRRLAQMVDHVLRSAASVTEAGGAVELELTADADGAGASFVVRHPGSGLETQALESLFDQPESLEGVRRGVRGAPGLGLVLVRSLVEMHGGRVFRVGDETGRGSAFGLWLPLRGAEVVPPSRDLLTGGSARL